MSLMCIILCTHAYLSSSVELDAADDGDECFSCVSQHDIVDNAYCLPDVALEVL